MANGDPLKDVLDALNSEVFSAIEPALRRAFAEGYKKGAADTQQNIADILSAKTSELLPAILGANSVPPGVESDGIRRSPPLRGAQEHKRRYAYGSVIGAVRKAIAAHPQQGITREGIRQYCKTRFDMDISTSSVRETLKRLRSDNEAYYADGVWWPGDEIKPAEHDENEPRNGNSDGGSESGQLFGIAARQ